ncbi:MAG: methyltransferase domain-containing protein, partial [Acidobacteriota bacterium]
RLRPGISPAGRDDNWTGSIEGIVAAVQAITPAAGSVLHVGAGQGQVVEALAKTGLRPWGADVARRLDRPDRNRYSKATPLSLPFADHVFATVVVSADWLEHLEPDDLDLAVAELARVGRDAILVEVSGRPLRANRAFDRECSPEWWQRRLSSFGLRARELPVTSLDLTGPTGGKVLSMSAPAHLCPSCRRVHGRPDEFEPVHPGVLAAAETLRRYPRLGDRS